MLNTLAVDKKYLLHKIETLSKIDMSNIKSEDINNFIQKQNNNSILRVENGVASIEIYGELTNKKDWISALFGFKQTTYADILSSLNKVAEDESVEKVELLISSPGGQVSGLMNVMNVIANYPKEIVSIVDMCCSAAYFIASQTKNITASNKLSMIGSVGVLASFIDDSEYMEKLGVKDIVITSTDAPNKYADPATKKGYDLIQKELDSIHEVLVKEISASRNIDVEYINVNFGKGGVFLAEKALESKMIDNIKTIATKQNSVGVEANSMLESNNKTISNDEMDKIPNKEEKSMDLKELQMNHPELYSSVFEMGIKAERARIEKLNGWAKANPETAEIISQAITQGATAEDVMPELMAVIKTGHASVKIAEKDSAEPIAQASAEPHKQPEPALAKSPDADKDFDVDAIAKNVAQMIF